MAVRDGIKNILRMCGHAFTSTVHDRLETMEQRQAETDNVLLRASLRLAEQVRRSGRYEVIAAENPQHFIPALALVRYLYSTFPSPRVLAIGDERWARELATCGYQVETQGSDTTSGLAIVRVAGAAGLGELDPAVVVADLEAAAEAPVKAMRARGYQWHIVVETPRTGEAGRFYANYAVILPGMNGHTIFFRDHSTFLGALQWCAAVLREIYFGPLEEPD